MQADTGSVAPPAADLTVCDLIDRQAARLPYKTAVIDGPQHTTYAALLAAADRRAQFLEARGVEPGALIGIAMERSLEMVLWVLAILKAGAAYVPLDPRYPADRLRFVVEDAGLRLAIVDAPVDAPVAAPAAVWAAGLPLDLIAAQETGAASERLSVPQFTTVFPNRATTANTAYVIYTSGSTGMPKGVEVSHAALAHFVQIVPEALGIREDDIWLLTASISYAVQVRQLLTPLTVGATIAVATELDLRDPVVLMETVKAYGVTLVDFVPSYWRTCNRVLAALPTAVRACLLDNRLRQIVSVGEPLTYDLAQTWSHTFGHGARIVNILGQTETTGMFTSYALPPDVGSCDRVVPVGVPVRDVELQLLDAAGKPVADGEAGEVYLCTPCLARGYLNRPELTAQRFLPHPTRTLAGARLYRTGDLARRRPDGNLQYLGRIDQQVKVRGKRVDLIEVESYLRHAARVQDAAVVATQNGDAETEIVGYVAAEPHVQLSLKAIWAELRLHLPEHALPDQIYRIESLPYLPNGKLDRHSLALALDSANASAILLTLAGSCDEQNEPAGDGVCGCRLSPQTAPEAMHAILQAAWTDLLGVDRVCLDDDFFAIGGTSLKAALLAARVGLELGKRVPVDLIYRAPTLATLARALSRLPARGSESTPEIADDALVLLRPGDNVPPLFIVHGLGGGIVGYADLVHHLPPGYPIYGLKAVGLDSDAEPHATIEAMAAHYVQAVRSIQPAGPYRLCGYCYGGVVAFEMARQLAADGERQQLVAIIEGYAPGWRAHPGAILHPERLRLLAGNMPFWWRDYRALGSDVLRRRVARKLRPQGPAAPNGCTPPHGMAQEILDDDLSLLPEYRQRLLEIHLLAIRSYAPTKYPGTVTIFRGRNRTISQVMTGPLDVDLGWSRLAAGVTVHEVEGAHRNIHLMPHVRSLAAVLSTYLAPAG